MSRKATFGKLRRIVAMSRKEARQMMRDPSSIALGIVLPLLLILLFGYGLSLDAHHVPVAVVMEDHSPSAQSVFGAFAGSRYFQPQAVNSMVQANRLLTAGTVDGIVRLRHNFSRNLRAGHANIQFTTNSIDANRARLIENYASGVVSGWLAQRELTHGQHYYQPVTMQQQIWFNRSMDSRYFLVPGLLVLIMTLIGALMTALVVAREWERGTFESLFATPVQPGEIVISKIIPYFCLGMVGLAVAVTAARMLFQVPIRGSLPVLILVSALYLLVALGMGLLISTRTKNQFIASQAALLLTFLPAMMLSGFIFDIRSMPPAIQAITYVLPARYFVALLQTLFLAGDIWSVILPNTAVLVLMAIIFLGLTRRLTVKRLV
ncbi:MAG: ABC transporter permease [Phycisphaerae bacterium]